MAGDSNDESAVDLDGNGTTDVLAGARGAHLSAACDFAGTVYVFVAQQVGGQFAGWERRQIYAPDGDASHYFGSALARAVARTGVHRPHGRDRRRGVRGGTDLRLSRVLSGTLGARTRSSHPTWRTPWRLSSFSPLWLNEGLAEFFAAGRLHDRPAVFGLPHTWHLHVLRTRDWLPMTAVLSATRGAASVTDTATSAAFYAQAWALVHYLKLGDGGRHAAALTAFTALVTQGAPAARAAVKAFGDLASLERRLREYVRGDRFFDARLPVPADEQAAASRRFEHTPPWKATLLVGDFLTHVVHYADAERHLARAEALAPGSAALCERRALA